MKNNVLAISAEETDALTGLLSKEGFYHHVAEALSRAPQEERYLVYANIDDFKLVNDLFGRKKGNEVLRKTAAYLRSLCTADDANAHSGEESAKHNHAAASHATRGRLCARIAADRFAVCLSAQEFSERALLSVADKLSTVIKRMASPVTIRFGVYKVENRKTDVSVMAGYAKRALKTIKGDSVKRIAYYDHSFLEQKQHEQRVVSAFDAALKDRQFHIYLQPQISAESGLQGAEVLVRWVHPRRGLVPPSEFIGTLEKTGLISELDKAVWEEAAALLQRWQGTSKEALYLSINLSAKDFYYLDVFQTITDIVERYRIAPQKLRLEITESVLMSDVEKLLDITRRLHQRGFFIEIDDFGKGYSSLSMLKDIDVDVLKIDMEFLRKTEHEEKSRIILESIIAMTKRLGIAVITEGVETAAQKELLQSLGCNLFQGYYFAKPMAVEDFERTYFDAAAAYAS